MNRFGQHTKLRARPGRRDELVAKFLEVGEIQRTNDACELTFVSVSADDEDAVYLTEVWTSEAEHTRARESDAAAAWAEGMQELVAGPPQTERFEPVGGKGLGDAQQRR